MQIRQEYINNVADIVDISCKDCQSHSEKSAKTFQGIALESIKQLGETYTSQSIDISWFTNHLISRCHECFEQGRTGELTRRFTCGIWSRTQESMVELPSET